MGTVKPIMCYLHVLHTQVDHLSLPDMVTSSMDAIEAETQAIHYSIAEETADELDDASPSSPGSQSGSVGAGKSAFPSGGELKMWLLTLLLQSLADQWATLSLTPVDKNTIVDFMADAASQLIFDSEHPSISNWHFKLVLGKAMVRFSKEAGVEYTPTYVQTSPSGSKSDGNDDVPQSGTLELNLRIHLECFLSITQEADTDVDESTASEVMHWLHCYNTDASSDITLTAERALQVIYHLDLALRTRLDPEQPGDELHIGAVHTIIPVFRKFLKWWWWCLSKPVKWDQKPGTEEDDIAPLSGPSDERLAPDADPQIIEKLIFSNWWLAVRKTNILPSVGALNSSDKPIDASSFRQRTASNIDVRATACVSTCRYRAGRVSLYIYAMRLCVQLGSWTHLCMCAC